MTDGRRIDIVARAAVGIMTLVLVVMLGRVVQLQLAPSERLVAHLNPRVAHRTVLAPRGPVVDRRSRQLAATEFGYQVFVDPVELPKPADEAIMALCDTLRADPSEVGPKIVRAVAINRQRESQTPEPAKAEPGKGLAAMWTGLKELGGAIAGESEAEEEPETDGPKPIRYVRISGVLDDATIAAVKALKIPGVHIEQRAVREYPSGSLAASIIGKVNIDHDGALGIERTRDAEMAATDGRIAYVRDARGRPLWIGPGSYDQPRSGGDVRLSIDMEVQRLASEELSRGIEEYDAAGGRAVVMDVATGEILAMVDQLRPVPDAVPFPWPAAGPASSVQPIPRARYLVIKPDPGRLVHPALGRNRCVEDIYEPGSTFKPFVWATITSAGKARPSEVFNTGDGTWITPYGRLLHDVHKFPHLTWLNVLVQSSNIGMAQGADRMSHDAMFKAIRSFGFGSKPGLGLPGETAGRVTPRRDWSKYTQTSVSFGQEIAVTPVQMARAFCVFARDGELLGTLPPARLSAADPGDAESTVIHRLLGEQAVMLTRQALTEVAGQMEAKMAAHKEHPEFGWRYSIFGKSGTAQIPLGKAPAGKRRPPGVGYYEKQYNASFIAAGPAEDPKIVVLVVIDDPGPALVRGNVYYGSQTAGPVARRVMERALGYLGVSPSPPRTSPLVATAGPLAD